MYNLVDVFRCFFYGDISPKSDPIRYGQNVADLYTHFQHQYCNDGRTKMPLVINTHGWVKGTWQYSVSLLMQIDTWYLTRFSAALMALVNHSFGHHTLVLNGNKISRQKINGVVIHRKYAFVLYQHVHEVSNFQLQEHSWSWFWFLVSVGCLSWGNTVTR
jgi:hypothetical protein